MHQKDGSLDITAIRGLYPSLSQQVNGHPLAYLDSAASALVPEPVIRRLDAYHRLEHSNVHRGIHTLSQRATDAYEATRDKVARLLNAAQREEIVFTSGTTESINLVAFSWGESLQPGDEILVSEMEHHANIVPWQLIAQRRGAVVKAIPILDSGDLDLEAYRSMLSSKVKLVGIVHLSNALGTLNPVDEIIRLAHANGSLVLLDAAQSAAHMRLDVRSLGCDFLTFSAHKLGGPTGFGVLYARKDLLDAMPPFKGGGNMIRRVAFSGTTYHDSPFRFEPGTPPIAAGIGFGAALELLESIGFEAIQRYEEELLAYAVDALGSIDGVRLVGNPRHRSSVLPFTLEGIHAYDAGMILDRHGVAVRTGHHCAQPVLERYGLDATIRASLMYYNDTTDVDRLIYGIEAAKRFFA